MAEKSDEKSGNSADLAAEKARQRAEYEAKKRSLPPEALRALEEAEARRAVETEAETPQERGGRKGPEPTRYGDWEKKGLLSDF